MSYREAVLAELAEIKARVEASDRQSEAFRMAVAEYNAVLDDAAVVFDEPLDGAHELEVSLITSKLYLSIRDEYARHGQGKRIL